MKTIWYMGVKSRLIPGFIAEAVSGAAPEGSTLLDLFSGSGSVASALAPRHRVVANDVQRYAGVIARAHLVHDERRKAAFLASLDPERDLLPAFGENQDALARPLSEALALEDAFLRAHDLEPARPDDALTLLPEAAVRGPCRTGPLDAAAYRRFALEGTPLFDEARAATFAGPFEGARGLLGRDAILARRADPSRFPACLATAYYPNVYLGLRQAIATDSLRRAIDAIPDGPFAREKRDHYLSALLHALSVTTSATSHFCQPRGLTSENEVRAVLARRAVSIASRTLAWSREIAATVAATPLRAGNAVTSGDWRALFRPDGEGARAWALPEARADVVYVDPPYTADNYSRFYHLLEVVTDYDYPPLDVRGGEATKGRYPARERRHQSAFCRRATVEGELRDLLAACARAGAAVVLSYSLESGLLFKRWRQDEGLDGARALERFRDLAREHFGSVELREKALRHSGQGDSNPVVTELLLTCRRPRATRAARPGARALGRRPSRETA